MMNLKQLKVDIKNWLTSIYVGNGRYKFSGHAVREYSLDAAGLAVDLENMVGNSLEDRKELIVDFFNQHQRKETGLFFEDFEDEELDEHEIPRVKEMSETYLGFQTAGAFRVIQRFPNYHFSFYEPYILKQATKDYMTDNMPWDRSPWGAGGMVDSMSTMVSMNIDMGYKEYQDCLDAIFEWLYENQDSTTGLWGNIDAQGLAGIVNGGYHLSRGTFFWHNRELRYVTKIIDILLEHIKTDPIFTPKNGDGCYDLDAFFLLQKCHEQEPRYRKDEVIAVCEKRLKEIEYMKKPDGGFSFEPEGSTTEHNYYKVTEGRAESGVQGTVFYLQTLISIYAILDPGKDTGFKNSLTHGILSNID